MRKILISHRHGDCPESASHVELRLRHRFGHAAVSSMFHILFGGLYDPERVKAHVAEGAVLLVLIGPCWIKSPFDGEQPWLEDVQYHVRLEIESALTHGVPIIPVLLDGRPFPQPATFRGACTGSSIAKLSPSELSHILTRIWTD
jgi:hypothetical protein